MRTRSRKQRHINIVTLGCSKNLVDSENLLTQLKAGQLSVTHEGPEDQAEVVVVNTCGFIDKAKEESVNTILHYIDEKAAGKIEELYVTGCLSERYKDDLRAEMPEVNGFYGTLDMPALVQRLGADYKQELIGERQTTTSGHYAYLKIAEGCNRPCGFCAIPLMRGGHVSRSIESLVDEARFLVSRGVKELMLIAQELTFYGIDLYGSRKLAELLEALAGVKGLEWIRLHYAYPAGFPMEILPVIREHENICSYLDLPLQHIANPVLRNMRRGITREKTLRLVEEIRQQVPGIALRTTMLVGYPGEDEAAFEQLLDFIEDVRFERLGVFTYSHEEGTYAHKKFADDIPAELKAERADVVMELQQSISAELNAERVGQRLRVLVDRQEGDSWVARTEWDSPEVDNEVLLTSDAPLQIGQFYEAEIYDATEFDLFGRV